MQKSLVTIVPDLVPLETHLLTWVAELHASELVCSCTVYFVVRPYTDILLNVNIYR